MLRPLNCEENRDWTVFFGSDEQGIFNKKCYQGKMSLPQGIADYN
jgi:hypothetical protein